MSPLRDGIAKTAAVGGRIRKQVTSQYFVLLFFILIGSQQVRSLLLFGRRLENG